ncbi:MAG: substrate-binding domain-containing protein, partial [Anaerolineae bacterium]|nr:substrate-binding domain-containing protein [Anaerolineae bacterium]
TPARTPIEIRVGTDALAVVVNPANDFISDATIEQLNQIFSTAETWADVDPSWPAEPILRFIPGTDSGTFDYFVEAVFEEDEGPILAASNTQLSEDDNVLLEGVANNPYAIGFFGYAYYDQNQDELKILNVEGLEPVAANVDNNTYPLARPLFMYSDAGIISEKPQVGQFISYYLQNVNDLIGEVGYFPANASALNEAKLEIQALLSAGM